MHGALVTVLAQFDVPGIGSDGPDRLQSILRLLYVCFGVGAVISLLGYALPSKLLQVTGIMLIFLAGALFIAASGVYG